MTDRNRTKNTVLSVVEKSKPPAMSIRGLFLLPEDIVLEIFIRLPVKSIGKSRCVSKQWNSLLTSPRFIKAHLGRSQQKKLLIRNKHGSLFTSTLRPDGVAEGTFKDRLSIPPLHRFKESVSIPPLDEYSTPSFVGHCNGLVVIQMDTDLYSPSYLLMNPTTLEYFILPELPTSHVLGFYKRGIRYGYGFGYDSSRDDYKVVIISKVYDFRVCNIYADIYSVKTKSWRRVDLDCPFIAGGSNIDQAGVFVNGALHWMSRNPNDPILAFDLGSEKFYEIPSIGSLRGKHKYEDCSLIASRGCLGIVGWDGLRFPIWTMNKYGIANSWTENVYNVDFVREPGQWIATTRPWRYAIVIQRPYKLMFYSYDDEKSFTMTLDTRHIKDLWDDGNGRIDDGLIFSESLVSPHHFDTQQLEEVEEYVGAMSISCGGKNERE